MGGLFAQNDKLKYSQKLTISNGLAHNGVTSMLEDSRGYLWFGTYDGINKYNGIEIKTFKNTIDREILTSNRVRALAEDSKGNIWIGTEEGINVYNYSQERFLKIYSNELEGKGNSGPIVRSILINKESGLIICATEGDGILVFNEDYSFVHQYEPSSEFPDDTVLFYKGIMLDRDNYIFTTSRGLLLFNSSSNHFKRILQNDLDYCNSVIEKDDNTLIVTLLYGIAQIEIESDQNNYTFKLKQKSLENYQFNNALLDPLGNLWLSELNKGIIHIDTINAQKNHQPLKEKVFNDDHGILRGSCFLYTTDNSCWFASFNEGIYQFDINDNPFKNYNTAMDYDFGLNSNSVTHIAPLDRNRAYLSAALGGVALFNTQTQKFEPLSLKLPKGLEMKISAVYVDSRQNTWIRIDGEPGLRRIKKGKGSLEKVTFVGIPLANDLIIRSFTEDKYGNLWIGTNNGAYKISLNGSNEIDTIESLNDSPYFKDNKLSLARFVYADPLYDFVWIGADSNGLFRIDNQKDTPVGKLTVKQFVKDINDGHSISSNFVTAIIRLPNEEFWIGTEGGGICKVLKSESEPEFIAYTEKDGLTNNVVKSILYDDEYNLWVATNIGLNKFDTKDNKFRKFNDSDGLPFEDFWFAAKRLDNGVMVLSGLDGFCYFNPKEIRNKEKLPGLQFENLKIFNKTIASGDTINGRVILSKNLSESEKIILKHNENVFSLELTSLHFSNPENHSLKYKLSPINEEWIEVPSSQNTVSFSGLQPDDYELSVMASNSLNEWTPPKNLEIVIKPSIWNTHLAYAIYLILGLLLAYTVVLVILKIQALNYKVEIEHLEIDNVKKVNEAKLRSFSNISHEIKTPLTLISGPLEVLAERFKGNTDVSEKLGLMQRQSKKILQLIEQVQDFRRADSNLLKMEYSRFNFDVFVKDLIEDFKFLAKTENKDLKVVGEGNPIIVSADKDKLEKIFNNLLNNAFKYTKTNDFIKITYRSDGKDLIVSVSDTGRGIDSKDLSHIFERFYQSYKKEDVHMSGSGIGLAFSKRLVEMHYGFIDAESELGKGTIINVRLPVVKKHLESDSIEEIVLPKEKEVVIDNQLIEYATPTDIVVSGDFSESLIFYAEDNQEMRNYVSGILSQFFKIKTFVNGKECLEAMEDEWPDIVISDVQMPELNGLDLCIRIKSDLKTSHIPVILLTALTNIKDHVQGIRDGADAYIKKPFNVQRLVANTEALLATRKKLRERYQVGIPLTKENNKNNRNDNAFLDKLYSLMEENLDNQDFDLNGLAKELYLNRTHFYQKVKVLTNQTPFELLKMYRLKKAAEFLIQKNLTVNEVFVMTGFKSRTHFTKIFKEKYNISPSKYADAIKEKYADE
ncbi:response regulator [Maribacter sp. ANRC-HE7]|uniref:histidine kinase n=1 Tax=Maribacter aquimaris TaxID=2737171 RepID=A0ABR7UZ00_9FLAO|nr:hybrid sensor histidine kinase/response regulator transcription factor [Maribacter aquimaris]MBD0777521.1 response regulator [Maribacter aquimaris]